MSLQALPRTQPFFKATSRDAALESFKMMCPCTNSSGFRKFMSGNSTPMGFFTRFTRFSGTKPLRPSCHVAKWCGCKFDASSLASARAGRDFQTRPPAPATPATRGAFKPCCAQNRAPKAVNLLAIRATASARARGGEEANHARSRASLDKTNCRGAGKDTHAT